MKSGLCTLSKEPLKQPICVCRLGNLYNRDTLVQKIIEKTMPKEGFNHIRKLKDFKQITLPEGMSPEAKITCPITMKELNGYNKFIVYWTCGCIVSLAAQKEIGSAKSGKNECILCQTQVSGPDDIIDLNLTNEEKAIKYKKLVEEGKNEKKTKKRTHGDRKHEKAEEEKCGESYKKQKVLAIS